jgi:hypothetical protein
MRLAQRAAHCLCDLLPLGQFGLAIRTRSEMLSYRLALSRRESASHIKRQESLTALAIQFRLHDDCPPVPVI